MDTPSKPRLIYFNIKARAEPIRQAYHYGQVDFEDMRVSKDEFTALKDAGKCPSGQLPVLQLPSGETLSQSWAILRYVGRQTGLYPKDDMEAYKVDATFNLVEDVVGKLVPSLRESDPEKKMAMRKELAETILPQWLAYLDKIFVNGFVLGETLTVGDFAAMYVVDWIGSGIMDGIPPSVLDAFPNLTNLVKAVKAHPKMAGYNFV
eukprot:TRINITY_DN7569_c0_g1_i1.p1 TRINITY_DN7569_c0_g1~~TRINITY_DN7569_c0_g1_i1.p1  ORF type:complete len:206 (+),score=60.66 TRINITY_DN7569_c0_g1_i1:102-719(+)